MAKQKWQKQNVLIKFFTPNFKNMHIGCHPNLQSQRIPHFGDSIKVTKLICRLTNLRGLMMDLENLRVPDIFTRELKELLINSHLTVGCLSVDSGLVICQLSAVCWPAVVWLLADCWPTVDRLSADCWSFVG